MYLITGEQPDIPAGMSMTAAGPQPMGALQHESLMHQQLAALHQGAVAVQQNMGPEGIPPQRVPQPGMSPQQQQALAAHLQMQAQQGQLNKDNRNSREISLFKCQMYLALLSYLETL